MIKARAKLNQSQRYDRKIKKRRLSSRLGGLKTGCRDFVSTISASLISTAIIFGLRTIAGFGARFQRLMWTRR
jgi:hypothetical protein